MTRFKKRAAVLAMALMVGLGATACIPDTGPPPDDPMQREVFDSMNFGRWLTNLPPLQYSPRLQFEATVHTQDMANAGYIFHSDLNQQISRPEFAGFWTLGENVIVGPGGMTSTEMMNAWMASAGHRANILSPNFNTVGVAVWSGPDGRRYATALFGGHR